jgi:deoxyribose-phosphate aldolase
MTDHTLLKVGCTEEDIRKLCDEAIEYECASVCVPPCYVGFAKDYIAGRGGVKVCTVVGFPNGYSTAMTKASEAIEAKINGADEIDMVINGGKLKDGEYDYITDEISKIKFACQGRNLKVILETDLLTQDEIKKACELCIKGGADFVKTSTGFVKNGVGAKAEDVKLMYETVKDAGLQVKASGGIRDREAALRMIEAGAVRLGTSSGVHIINS